MILDHKEPLKSMFTWNRKKYDQSYMFKKAYFSRDFEKRRKIKFLRIPKIFRIQKIFQIYKNFWYLLGQYYWRNNHLRNSNLRNRNLRNSNQRNRDFS